MNIYDNQQTYLTPFEVCERYNLSKSFLAKLRLTGGGPCYAKAGRKVLYRVEDVEGWLESKLRRNTSEAE